MYGKWTVRSPRPRPRFGCPRRDWVMTISPSDDAACGAAHAPSRKQRGPLRLSLLGGIAKRFVRLLHRRFEVLARLRPRLTLDRDGALAHAFELVLARMLAAPAFARTVFVPLAVVALHRGLLALAP